MASQGRLAAPTPGMWPRKTRKATSCTECRRRKQKCNKLQPCGNCKRRFPEPDCQYEYLLATYDPPSRGYLEPRHSSLQRPVLFFPVSLPASTPNAFQLRQRLRPMPPSWPALQHRPSLECGKRRTKRLVVRWAGVNLTTEYPVFGESDSEVEDEVSDDVADEAVARADSKNANATAAAGATTTGQVAFQNAAAAVADDDHPDSRLTQQKTTPPSSTAVAVSPIQRAQRSLQQHPVVLARKQHSADTARSLNPWSLSGPVEGLDSLPIPMTKQHAMLIHTFGEVLHRLKGSFDGRPDDDNPFVLHYVPWCVQSPLLVHTSLYIAAQPLAERQYLDDTTTMHIKGRAINVLNRHLRTAACTDDEAMGAVAQFISIEFFYGSAQVMLAHLEGLRGMVCLRGGFSASLVGRLVTKVALVGDCIIALALESTPILQKPAAFPFTYAEPTAPVFRPSFNCALLKPRLPFALCAGLLKLHPATAWILDDVGFLINAVLALPPGPPTEGNLEHIQATALWAEQRVSCLPADPPESERVSSTAQCAKGPNLDDSQFTAVDHAGQEHTLLEKTASKASNATKGHPPPKPYSLLPSYPEFSSKMPSPRASPRSSPPPPPLPHTEPRPEEAAAEARMLALSSRPLYVAVRLAALTYIRAIARRQPLSVVCSVDDVLAILAALWRVPLEDWRGVLGIIVFIVAAIMPTIHQHSDREGGGGGIRSHVHSRFAKSVLQIGLMNVALEDWPTCQEIMSRSMRLQQWLRGNESRST